MYRSKLTGRGLKRIAQRVALVPAILGAGSEALGTGGGAVCLDTLLVETGPRTDTIAQQRLAGGANLRARRTSLEHRAGRNRDAR